MTVLYTILKIVFIIVCIALTVLVITQEGKTQGLGAIAGESDTYWGKNKSRSVEGKLVTATRVCAVLFFVLGLVLNLKIF